MKYLITLLALASLTGCNASKESMELVYDGCDVGNTMTLTYTKSTFTNSVSLSCTFTKTEE